MSRRVAVAAAFALVSGAAVIGVTATIDSTYEAEASAPLRPVVGDDDLLTVLRLERRFRQLDGASEAPLLPEGEHALERIATAAGVSPDDLEVVDSDAAPLFAAFRKPPRRLKVVVEGSDATRAARAATAVLREYLDYRRRWYARELGEVERYLEAKVRRKRAPRPLFPSGPAHPEEGLTAVRLLRRLEAQAFGPVHAASVPGDPVSPRKWRDVLVAVLIGALAGWLAAPRILRASSR